jgi:hypothetical protein
MALYPYSPIPANTSVSTITDPPYIFESDFGYRVVRTRYPRPLRRFQLEYLGITTQEMRVLREFLIRHRLSVTPFAYNPYLVYDRALIANTTPIILTMVDSQSIMQTHEFVTGQWVLLWNSTVPGLDGTGHRVTVPNANQLILDGTVAQGTGFTDVRIYLPRATGVFEDGVMPSPAKLLGPESTYTERAKFSMTVQIQELL